MTLWRLEWLRLARTHRLLAILGVYVFLGLTGPLSARYLASIIDRFASDGVRVQFPTPRPVDGIAQFTSNATQLGLLTVVLVAASALAFDARHEMAVFLRTRVDVPGIVLPAYVVNAAAAVTGFLAGASAAWYETAVLLGAPPPGRMLVGMGLGSLFLGFAVAATALAAAWARGAVAAAGLTLAVLLGMAIAGAVRPVAQWSPASLATAMPALLRGGEPVDYLPAAGVALVFTVVCLAFAIRLGRRREL